MRKSKTDWHGGHKIYRNLGVVVTIRIAQGLPFQVSAGGFRAFRNVYRSKVLLAGAAVGAGKYMQVACHIKYWFGWQIQAISKASAVYEL